MVLHHYHIEASSIMFVEVYSHSWLTQFLNGLISIIQLIHQNTGWETSKASYSNEISQNLKLNPGIH